MLAPNPPTLWSVPYQRNPFFTGRDEVLGPTASCLTGSCYSGTFHPQGISGLGGIGKTQTALEYAYRYREEYQATFWVRAGTHLARFSPTLYVSPICYNSQRERCKINISLSKLSNAGFTSTLPGYSFLIMLKIYPPFMHFYQRVAVDTSFSRREHNHWVVLPNVSR